MSIFTIEFLRNLDVEFLIIGEFDLSGRILYIVWVACSVQYFSESIRSPYA